MSADKLPSREELEALFGRSARARMEAAKAALREAGVAPTGRPMLSQVAPGQWAVSFIPGLVLMEALTPQERAQAEAMLAAEPEAPGAADVIDGKAAAPESPETKEEAQSDE